MAPPADSVVLLALVVGFCLGAFLAGSPVCERRKLKRTAKKVAQLESACAANFTALMGMRSLWRALQDRVEALEGKNHLMEDDQK